MNSKYYDVVNFSIHNMSFPKLQFLHLLTCTCMCPYILILCHIKIAKEETPQGKHLLDCTCLLQLDASRCFELQLPSVADNMSSHENSWEFLQHIWRTASWGCLYYTYFFFNITVIQLLIYVLELC